MKNILLISFFLVSLLITQAWAQERTVTGKVTAAEDEAALPGVNVLLKGSTIGTVTDIDGNYTLTVPAEGGVLIFSFIGLLTQEIEIGNRGVINVAMESDVQQLTEVVVVAYGQQTKQAITGAVDEIESEIISKVQAGNVVQGLVGKVPGVQIINQSGQPGDGPSVRFRGIGSINATNEPLYVLDGIPFNGNINSISPHDIASMTFLKDASANALYGSRGANGVILITSKKGDESGLQVTFDAKYGVNSRAVPEYDIVDDPGTFYETWYDRIRLSLIRDGIDPSDAAGQAATGLVTGDFGLGYNNYDVDENQLINPATGQINPDANLLYHDDWGEALFDNSARQEYYIGLRSEGDKVGTYFSVGYLEDQGYALNSGFERITSRLSLDYTYNDHLKVGGSINYAHTDQDAPIQNVATNTYSNLFSWARNVAPIYPVYARDESRNLIRDEEGNTVYDFGTNDDGIPGLRPYGAFNNPVATSLLDIDENIFNNFSARLFGTVSFLNNFQFTYNVSADIYNGDFTELATPIGGDAKGVNGRLTVGSSTGSTLAHQQLLNWNKNFGEHSFAVMLGHESSDFAFEFQDAERTNLVISDLPVLNNTSNFQGLENYKRDYNIEGFLGRINYNFRNKYFINANYRRDGSSVFSEDSRWGNFYGLGAAWIISDENFMDNANFINNLKLKASTGQQGNDNFDYEGTTERNYYADANLYEVVNIGGGVPGVIFYILGNPELQWENSINRNFGFELLAFDNRISLDAAYFIRKVEDMIFYNPLPLSKGAEVLPENVGDMKNNGIEVALGATILDNDDLNWAININATHFKNEITRLPDESIDDGDFRLEEGRSRYDYYMREFAGIDPENGDALWYIDELDESGNATGSRTTTNVHSDATEYYVGKSAIPDLYGGFSSYLEFKGFSLDLGFAFQLGGYGFDEVYQGLLGSAGDIGQNYHKDVLDSWTPENTNASIPRLDVSDDDQDNNSDFWLVDASYLSFQNVTLGYRLPATFLERMDINSTMIYVTANNVYLWSEREGYDPRLSTVGTASNEYSIVRSVSVGLTVKF